MPKRETLKKAGYTYVRPLGDGEHLLRDSDGKYEVWFANRGHASYGLKWNNTDLEFARSAAIPNYGQPDVFVRNEGSIFLLTPMTDAAREWIGEHIPEDAQYMGRSLVVEHRYVEDIVAGMQVDGLIVK